MNYLIQAIKSEKEFRAYLRMVDNMLQDIRNHAEKHRFEGMYIRYTQYQTELLNLAIERGYVCQ